MVEKKEKMTAFDIEATVTASINKLFGSMLDLPVEPAYGTTIDYGEEERITTSVSYAGELTGTFYLHVSKRFGAILAMAMLGLAEDELDGITEIKDTLLEISNMLAGNLKSSFNDAGMPCYITTPSVTVGSDFSINTLNMARYECFVFRCQEHLFAAEVCVRPADEKNAAELIQRLSAIDISKFSRLDIISTTGDKMVELFDTMLKLDLEFSDKTSKDEIAGLIFVGTINFAGDVRGSLSLKVPEKFAKIIASKVLEKNLEDITDSADIKDPIGELANIVAGNLKSAFCDSGLICEISPPIITFGSDFKIEILNMARYERFAFSFYEFDIFVDISIKIDDETEQKLETNKNLADKAAAEAEDIYGTDHSVNKEFVGNIVMSPEEIGALFAEAEAKDAEEAAKKISENTFVPDNAKLPAEQNESLTNEKQFYPNLKALLDVTLDITVELGNTKIPINDVLNLNKGSVVNLTQLEGEPINIMANNNLIAKGELVVVREKYGVRIKEVVSRVDRIRGLYY